MTYFLKYGWLRAKQMLRNPKRTQVKGMHLILCPSLCLSSQVHLKVIEVMLQLHCQVFRVGDQLLLQQVLQSFLQSFLLLFVR